MVPQQQKRQSSTIYSSFHSAATFQPSRFDFGVCSKFYRFLVFDFDEMATGLLQCKRKGVSQGNSIAEINVDSLFTGSQEKDSSNYIWKVSLWTANAVRIAADILIPVGLPMKSTETMQHFALEQEQLLKELDREDVVKGKSKAVLLHMELLHRYTGIPILYGSCNISSECSNENLNSSTFSLTLSVNNSNVKNFMNLNPWLSISACKISVKFSLHKIMTPEKLFSRDCNVKFKKDLLDYRDAGKDKAYFVPVQIISWDIFNMSRYLIDLPSSHRAVDMALNRTIDYCRRDFRTIFNDEDSKSILPVKQSYFATVQDFQISSDILELYFDHRIQVTASFGCVNHSTNSRPSLDQGCQAPYTHAPPISYLGAMEHNSGMWVQHAELYPLGFLNEYAHHCECQAGAHFLDIQVSVFDCIRDSGGKSLKPSKFVKCYESNSIPSLSESHSKATVVADKRNVIVQSILCQGKASLQDRPVGDMTDVEYEIPLFTQVQIGLSVAEKTIPVGKVLLSLHRVRSDSYQVVKMQSLSDGSFASDPQLDAVIDQADKHSDPSSRIQSQLYEDFFRPNYSDEDFIYKIIKMLLYCCEKLNQLDLLRSSSGEIDDQSTVSKLPQTLEAFQKQVFVAMGESLSLLCCPLHTEPSRFAFVLAAIVKHADIKNVFVKAANYFLEYWLSTAEIAAAFFSPPESEANEDSFLMLLGTEKSWKVIRGGLFVVKLLGSIYRLDKSSPSSDMDGTAMRDVFGGAEVAVDVEEEVIYYDHLFEISHEIVCTLSLRLSQVLQGVISNMTINARTKFEALLQRLSNSVPNTFVVFDIVAHVIVCKCPFPGQTLKKYSSTMQRCLLTILRGAESVAIFLNTILSTHIPLSDTVKTFLLEMSLIVLRVLRICVRFVRVSRDDGSITNEGSDFLSMISSTITIIARICKTVGNSAMVRTAIGTLLSELQVQLVSILSSYSDPEKAAFGDRLSIQIPHTNGQWIEKNDQFISPSEPRRRAYHYSSATHIATANKDSNGGSESKTAQLYPSTPYGAGYSPYALQDNFLLDDVLASDKLSIFLILCRPLLNGIISLLSLDQVAHRIDEKRATSEQRADSFLLWMRSIIDLVLILRSKLRSFYDFQYANQVDGGPDSEAMFILCEFLAAIDYFVYRDLKNRLETNESENSFQMSNVAGQQSSYSIMIAVLVSSALNNRKLGLEPMRQEIASNKLSYSSVDDDVVFPMSQSHSTMSLWLSMRDNLVRALLAIVERTGELCMMSSRTAEQLSCLTHYSQLLWEVSLFAIEGLPAVVGDILTHSNTTRSTLSFLLTNSFKLSGSDSSSAVQSIEDFRRGNLQCVVEILSSYFRADGKVPYSEGHDLCGIFFGVLHQMIGEALSQEGLATLVEAAFDSKLEIFAPLRCRSQRSNLISGDTTNVFHLLGVALDQRSKVDGDKSSLLLDVRIAFELHLHAVVLTLSTVRPKAVDNSGGKHNRSLDVVLNNTGMAYILVKNLKFILSKLVMKSKDRSEVDDDETKHCDGIEIILTKLSSDSSISSVSPISLLSANKGYLNLISILALISRCQLQAAPLDVEIEVRLLRNALSSLLVSGLWETGIALTEQFSSRYSQDFANSSENEFKMESLNFDVSTIKKASPFVGGSSPALSAFSADRISSPNHPVRSFSGGDDVLPSFTSPAISSAMKNKVTVTPGKKAGAVTATPSRLDTIKAELARTLERLKEKVKHDHALRLMPAYYALRIVSTSPFGFDNGDKLLKKRLSDLSIGAHVSSMSRVNTTFLHSNQYPAHATMGEDEVSSEENALFHEHWLLLRFDLVNSVDLTKSYEAFITGDGYKDYAMNEQENISHMRSLLPLTGHQKLLSQLTSAFPDAFVVPSHYSLDSLLQQGTFYPSSSTFIQLFQAFPAVACDIHGNPSEEKRNVDTEIGKRPDDGDAGDADDAAEMGSKVDSLYLPYVSATEFHVFSSDGDNADDGDSRREERLQYLRRFTLTTGASRYDKIAGEDVLRSINTNTADSAEVKVKDGDTNAENLLSLHAFAVYPAAIAACKSTTAVSPLQATFQVLSHHRLVLRRILRSLQQLSSFTAQELLNEQKESVVSSDVVFFSSFATVSAMMIAPNCSAVGLFNVELNIHAEKERLELEWLSFRKKAKREYMRQMSLFEEAGSGRRPVEPEISALRREFDRSSACSSSSSLSLDALQILAGRCMDDVALVLKEMRVIAVKTGESKQAVTPAIVKLTHDEIRNEAMRKGRRPTIASFSTALFMEKKLFGDDEKQSEEETVDANLDDSLFLGDGLNLKLKLCLYLESLFAAIEVGVSL